jgi:pimeloyl-ACP methyl ester carboxylesterase
LKAARNSAEKSSGCSHAFNKAIPGRELVVLTECGHSAYWQRPDMFNDAVLEFIKRRGA